MRILVLGGTAWLGGQIACAALERGHGVTCLARGQAGETPTGATFVRADRGEGAAGGAHSPYSAVSEQDWDGVVDVSWQPAFVRGAVQALAARTRTWVYVSSCSVYAAHDTPGADESAALLPALESDAATTEQYGEAKVACERVVLDGVGQERSVVARSGLIGGPGDHTDRTGYWPLRFAHPADPDGAVLVPDSPTLSTQVVDVRDLAAWLVRCVEESTHGVFNAAGPAMPLPGHLAQARAVAGHPRPLVPVSQEWLLEHEVQPWSGPRSLPLWLPLPDNAGFAARSTQAATDAGLVCRPLAETLAWEIARGPRRVRRAGLTPQDEISLIAAARSRPAAVAIRDLTAEVTPVSGSGGP